MLKKLSVLIFFGALFFITFSEQPNSASNSLPSPSPTKTPANKPAGVENLILDNETVYLPCPPGNESDNCPKDGMTVKVKALSKDAAKNNLNYYYAVSGGQIIGQGADVIWDLTGNRPGSYTITASVGKNNAIRGKTLTKTVEVLECPHCGGSCECPTLSSASSKKTVRKGETVEFSANLTGGSQEEPVYNWTVENGVIFEGQGTPNIKVQVLTGETVTAKVEIGGLCASCPPIESTETVKIIY